MDLLTQEDRETANVMIGDLERNMLRVVLIPSRVPEIADRGGKIRVATESNPLWYQELCLEYGSSRRRRNHAPDTLIKRKQVLNMLEAIVEERENRESVYYDRLLPYIKAETKRHSAFWEGFEPYIERV